MKRVLCWSMEWTWCTPGQQQHLLCLLRGTEHSRGGARCLDHLPTGPVHYFLLYHPHHSGPEGCNLKNPVKVSPAVLVFSCPSEEIINLLISTELSWCYLEGLNIPQMEQSPSAKKGRGFFGNIVLLLGRSVAVITHQWGTLLSALGFSGFCFNFGIAFMSSSYNQGNTGGCSASFLSRQFLYHHWPRHSTSVPSCVTYFLTISRFRHKLSPPGFLLSAASGVSLQCCSLFQSWAMTALQTCCCPIKI